MHDLNAIEMNRCADVQHGTDMRRRRWQESASKMIHDHQEDSRADNDKQGTNLLSSPKLRVVAPALFKLLTQTFLSPSFSVGYIIARMVLSRLRECLTPHV
jgi:hypothetical protein